MKSCRTVWPAGMTTDWVCIGCTPLMVAFRNVPRMVYEPAGSAISTKWPCAEVFVATVTPLGSITSTLPAPGGGSGSLQCGVENRLSTGPPSR